MNFLSELWRNLFGDNAPHESTFSEETTPRHKCSSTLYRDVFFRGELVGRVEISADEFESVLQQWKDEEDVRFKSIIEETLGWVSERSPDMADPVLIPDRFHLTKRVLDLPKGTLHCLKCDASYSMNQIVHLDECIRHGGNHNTLMNRYECPSGHVLCDLTSVTL